MAKDKITEYDATAANNTVVGDVNLAENSALPSDMNNAVREVMSHQKEAFGSGTPLYVDQTNNRVGVGNSAPSTALEVDDDGATVLTVDRATSDGAIIDVQKDGSTVGNIGSKVGDLTIGTDDTGFRFYDAGNAVLPYNPSTQASPANTVDLGDSGSSFKDLYLGGNLYIGGTGSANALDDYEEGEFDVDVSTSNLTVNTSQDRCRYTKIGRMVYVTGTIKFTSVTSSSDTVTITGLPFTAAGNVSGGEAYGHFAILLNNIDGGNAGNMALGSFSSTSATIYKKPESGSFDTLKTSDFNSSGNEIYFSGWYTAA